jgi:tRNA pseudouridine38-40 synthase
LSYNGEAYSGFARQKNPAIRTIQEELERALRTATRLPEISTVCAGRTDAGVHACAQVVSFDLPDTIAADLDFRRLQKSLNALTDDDISVTAVRRARDGFSARHDAIEREYRYRVCARPAPPLFGKDYACHVPQTLDVSAMERASFPLLGEHDFRSFCVASSADAAPTVREVRAMDFLLYEAFGEPLVTIRVVGDSFLHAMVRIIVGTLLEVGLGREREDFALRALQACSRGAAGPTAPARGLTLHRVAYPEDVWI